MKKLMLLLLLICSVYADELTKQEKDLAGRLVDVLGYRCSSVDDARKSLFDGSITIVCDGYAYSYNLKNIGGRWTIILKDR